MYDYSGQLNAFLEKRVRLPAEFREKLLGHREANRKRLISRLAEFIKGANIGEGNFMPQGSVASGTVIQTKFVDEEYDIDDGLVIPRRQLKKNGGVELTADEVRCAVRDGLKDKRFSRQPRLFTNCVRVFYAEEDEEKHHVDFPVYRRWEDEDGKVRRELASENGWVESDPTQVNSWFLDLVKKRNAAVDGWGSQLRNLIQLLKRFCRSRLEWLEAMPNGMKITMLVAECQPAYDGRIDLAFRTLLENIEQRLSNSAVITNLAHPDNPALTRTENDENVGVLLKNAVIALEDVETLDKEENENADSARKVWDAIFKSDGFFKEYDQSAGIEKSLSDSRSPFDVPWREKPIWPVIGRYSASLTGAYGNSEHGLTWHAFPSDGPPLSKHLYLRFHGQTDVPKPYQVYWQVVNTGSEAIFAGGLRGQIIKSTSVGAGGLTSTSCPTVEQRERTLYAGMHWIEFFVVKDSVCVARSGPFVVNIL